jgi:hypothetical protein
MGARGAGSPQTLCALPTMSWPSTARCYSEVGAALALSQAAINAGKDSMCGPDCPANDLFRRGLN